MQPSLHKFVDRAVVVTIQVAFVIFCCPVALCLALSPPKRRICTRHSHPPSSHACILIAPAPPPTYIALPATAGEWDSLLSHLRNDGNRIFHLRPDTGVLASGNIGAAVDGGVYFVGTPRLVAKVPTRMWKVMLGIFKSVRAEIVETFPPAKEKFWRRPKSWPEVEWVRRCAEVMAAAATAWEDTDEDCFEVWSVEAETMVPNVVVSETWDAWFGMGFSVEIADDSYLWACRTFTAENWPRNNPRVLDDHFPGQWSDDYIKGDAAPLQVDSGGFLRLLEIDRPRRSMDSGELEQEPNDES